MSNRRNYYRILQVRPDAPTVEIQASYRRLMQRMGAHAVGGGGELVASLLDEAWSVLREPRSRARYDAELGLVSEPPCPGRVEVVVSSGYGSDADDASLCCAFCSMQNGIRAEVGRQDNCRHCASPLYPAERRLSEPHAASDIERAGSRHELRFFAHGDTTRAYVGRSQEVSLQGMQFFSNHRPGVGQVIRIASPACQATARVVACDDAPETHNLRWCLRVEFVTLRLTLPERATASASA